MFLKIYLGANLLPESLETGEYKVGGTAEIDDLEPAYVVAYGSKEDFGYKYNGIYSGILYYAFTNSDQLRAWITNLAISNPERVEWIMSIFTVPKLAFYPLTEYSDPINTDFKATPRSITLSSTPNNLDGYIPKNQKLRTYPYMYIGFNPSGGTGKIYRYENFKNGIPKFDIITEININPQLAVIPIDYRGANGYSMADISTISGYPTISWSVDTYNSWLAQNSNLINLKMENLEQNQRFEQARNIGTVGSSLGKAFSKDITGAISTAIEGGMSYEQSQINYEYAQKEQIAQIEKQQMLPNNGHFGGNNSTLLGYNLFDKNIFTRYTIKSKFAKIIDDYFSMYGYQTNEVKVPNINNRPNWNYVKLIGANIIGNIPENDLLEIKDLFNNGITLWHNPITFLDYSKINR